MIVTVLKGHRLGLKGQSAGFYVVVAEKVPMSVFGRASLIIPKGSSNGVSGEGLPRRDPLSRKRSPWSPRPLSRELLCHFLYPNVLVRMVLSRSMASAVTFESGSRPSRIGGPPFLTARHFHQFLVLSLSARSARFVTFSSMVPANIATRKQVHKLHFTLYHLSGVS
jgi:hypothetical protein